MKHVSIYECELENVMYIRPVIFIPGIMGSKLQNAVTKKRAWEPDDENTWGAGHAEKGPEAKRATLIGPRTQNDFNPNFLEIYYDEDEDEVEETDELRRGYRALTTDSDTERYRRWSGLAQNYYAGFLRSIDGSYKLKQKNTFHYQRVYAHPYNWTASNQTSAERLAETVDYAIRDTQKWIVSKPTGVTVGGAVVPTLKALKPIIITHSMGGLVSRGYTQSDNRANADKIAGVLHIAMPTDGSPNAYANMLSGSDASFLTRRVLGADQIEATATAGNMPGPLELLPNHEYKDSKGVKATSARYTEGWMQVYGQNGKIAYSRPYPMPATESNYKAPPKGGIPDGDPYSQIYLNEKDWWRLIYKEHLNPGGDQDAAFAACRRSILNAKAFHIQINKHGKFHPNTRMLYSDSAAAEFQACEAVRWNLIKGKLPVPPDAKGWSNYKGKMSLYYSFSLLNTYQASFELERIKAPGDATVHRGAIAFEKGPLTEPTENGFNHTNAFTNNEVRDWVQKQLIIMAKEDIACMPAS